MASSASQRHPEERTRFGLAFAIVVSVIAHLVLIVLSLWVPVLSSNAAEAPEDESIQFTFAPPADDAEETESAKGEVPFETEPSAAPQELVLPSEADAGVPEIPVPTGATFPDVAQELIDQPESVDDLQQEEELARPDTEPDEPTPTELEPTQEPAGTDLPVQDDSAFVQGQDSPAQDRAPTEPRTGLDLNSAMRNFKQLIDRSRASRPVQSGQGTQQNVYQPDMSAVPVQGAPYGILEFSSRDYDWGDYSSQIYWAILKAWYRRMYESTPDFEKWAHANQQYLLNHKTRVRFVIERDGDVTGISLNGGSDCEPLDESALDALSEVILPPLPADFPRNYEEVNATFVATGEIMTMRQMFRYLRQIGFF